MILTEQGENGSQFSETLEADLGCAERHAPAINLIEHPVRQLPAQPRALGRIDARQILATPMWGDL
jgi:hypothetical protein